MGLETSVNEMEARQIENEKAKQELKDSKMEVVLKLEEKTGQLAGLLADNEALAERVNEQQEALSKQECELASLQHQLAERHSQAQ